jgi:short-subunit dehydrogenase
MSDELSARYGPWALVTGAAEGLGAEFASQVAGYGMNIYERYQVKNEA